MRKEFSVEIRKAAWWLPDHDPLGHGSVRVGLSIGT